MSEQIPMNDRFSRREARRQRLEERFNRPEGQSNWIVWFFGLLLILLGGVFFLQNTGIFMVPLVNWWAFFILLPALGCFERAIHYYHSADNQLTAAARSSLVFGALFTLVTLAFLFNISWLIFGPVLIVLAGFAILINNILR